MLHGIIIRTAVSTRPIHGVHMGVQCQLNPGLVGKREY